MDKDFEIYINIVGIKKVKYDLKESLSKATKQEQWNLIHDW